MNYNPHTYSSLLVSLAEACGVADLGLLASSHDLAKFMGVYGGLIFSFIVYWGLLSSNFDRDLFRWVLVDGCCFAQAYQLDDHAGWGGTISTTTL